jgi:transposase
VVTGRGPARALQEQCVALHPDQRTKETLLRCISACPSSPSLRWARTLQAQGHEVRLLPAQYVRAYVRRNKTDAADAAALIEASRCTEIRPVPIKSTDQQVLQQLHRVREQWKHTRTARINQLRGCLREFGIVIPVGSQRGIVAVRESLECADNGLPDALRPFVLDLLQEIAELEHRLKGIERMLRQLTHEDQVVRELLKIPGIGLLSATALRAALSDVQRFPSGRHFASWLGVTAREHPSGERRRLGAISKCGDVHLRTLLIHGARSALLAAKQALKAGRSLDRLRAWAHEIAGRRGHNKASVALANKIARIVWATWKYQRSFDGNWSSQPGAHR